MGYLIHHSIEESAHRSPEAEAFRFEGVALEYAELVARANQVANVLIDRGVRSMDRVGIYMHKCAEMPIALYGILKAGAAFVPIDPASPPTRIRFILEDCGIRHLIVGRSRERQAIGLVREMNTPITLIGPRKPEGGEEGFDPVPWSEVSEASRESRDLRLVESDLAYIMYTSGSTGAPKGLMHTHHSGLSYARLSARTYGVRPGDRLGNHAPLHFDISTFDFLTGPYAGATTVIIPEEATMFPVSLGALIGQERLTFWYSVPLALIQLVTRGEIETRDCSSLRWVLFGGEPFPPKYLRRLMDLWPQARFSNSYGPAEVNQCTCFHVPPDAVRGDAPVPLGRVWDGAEGRIVDEQDQAVKPGQIGELLIRAPTMMQGYWARPDLNATAFLTDEVQPGFSKRFYRTGDLVHESEEGLLMFAGRKDRQIKSRGYRIELDEVENVVGSLDEVAEAAALGIRSDDDAIDIVAVVRTSGDAKLDAEAMRTRIAERLPSYALPTRFIQMQDFPRTGSGKIDRRTLTESLETGSAQES